MDGSGKDSGFNSNGTPGTSRIQDTGETYFKFKYSGAQIFADGFLSHMDT